MRRILFTILASSALLAVVPATAFARQHHRSHHRSRNHHARVRHERLGSDGGQPGSAGAQQDAGTVQSFGGGKLTIMLNDGSTVTGAVTNATQLMCEAPDPAEMQTDDHGGGGDNGGGGGAQGNGDNGDRGDDQGQGDDQGEDAQTCATVVPGMIVREADLTISSAGAVWDKVELIAQH